MLKRWLPLALLIAGVTLGSTGIYLAVAPPDEAPALFAFEAERDLGERPLGEAQFTFPIANISKRKVMIVGLVEG